MGVPTVLSSTATTPAVERPAPVIQTPDPSLDDRLLVGRGASANNSAGRPFDPNLTVWQ